MTLYEELGLEPDCPDARITAAYREAAKSCHPDLYPGDEACRSRFERITFIRDVLLDPKRRAHYDATGDAVGLRADNSLVPLMTSLSAAFSAVMAALVKGNLDPRGGDMVVAMKSSLDNEFEQSVRQAVACERDLVRLRGIAGRFERLDEGENMVEAVVSGQIAGAEQQLVILKARADAAHEASCHLDSYAYRSDR